MKIKIVSFGFIIAALASVLVVNVASAATFNAGRIIDDHIFTRKGSMSVSQIQTFLNSKVIECDTDGSEPSEYGGGTRAQYAASKGVSTPFICLKDYSENGITSAQIIYNASQEFSINPQVLIVLIQKEQGLVTDEWPFPIQYKAATGYGCPDTAPCDSEYYGLTNQVRWSARMFRSILDNNPNWYTPYILGDNYIKWHPDYWNEATQSWENQCGGSVVNIENRSTQALYNYTPYQPNKAALSAGYGAGDDCSAYGNRNFFLYFNDWFSNTNVPQSNIVIPDGVYKLQNPTSIKFLDAANGGNSDGTRIWIYDRNTTAAQAWKITRDTDGFYSIQNVSSGKFIDVAGGSSSPGAKIQLWSGNNSCAQKWAATYQNDSYFFTNKCSGLSLDLVNGQLSNTTPVQTWEFNRSNAQKWALISQKLPPVANGFYEIVSSGNLALDLKDGQTSRGTPVQIYDKNGTGAQKWQITRQADGFYKIKNTASGKDLDVRNASSVPGALVQIWDKNSSCAQKWSVTDSVGSTGVIKSACSGLALDVSGGLVSTSGTGVQVFTPNGSSAQRWTLTNASPLTDGTYTLTTQGGKSLDIQYGKTTSGTPIQIWDKNGTGAQKWQFTRHSNGFYSISNPISGRYLDVRSGSVVPSAKVQIWDINPSCAQKWSVVTGNGIDTTIESACSGLALDVSGGLVSTSGTGVQVFTPNGSSAQRWTLGTQ